MTENQCCPKFNPEPWDKKIFEWENKKFIKEKVFTLFYIPINFGKAMVKLNNLIEKSDAKSPDWLCLSEHTSKWNMNVYLASDKEVVNANNVSISGKFLTKVYEGDFKETGKWSDDFKGFAKEKEVKIKKLYMWYTTCPKCAKKYGKNYVVIVAEVTDLK